MLSLTLPVPYIAAFLVILVALRILFTAQVTHWSRIAMSCFFGLLGLQAVLTGLQSCVPSFTAIGIVKPTLAMLVAPSAYLAFKSLTAVEAHQSLTRSWMHLLPPAMVALMMELGLAGTVPVDLIIGLSFLVYIALLINQIRLGPDSFASFSTEQTRSLVVVRWVTVGLLLVIATHDIAIVLDSTFFDLAMRQPLLVFGSIFLIALAFSLLVSPHPIPINIGPKKTPHAVTREEQSIMQKIETLMTEEKPFLDPRVSLTDIARTLDIPARLISQAINRTQAKNFSKFINQYRVRTASELLTMTERPVTEIMFEAGFQTKSTFNREFRALNGESPSSYRRS